MNLNTVDFETIFESTVASFDDMDNQKQQTLEEVQQSLKEKYENVDSLEEIDSTYETKCRDALLKRFMN